MVEEGGLCWHDYKATRPKTMEIRVTCFSFSHTPFGRPPPPKKNTPYIWRTIRHFFQIFTDHFLSQKFFRFLKTLDTVSLPCFVSLIPFPCLLPEALVVKIIRILAKFRFDFSSHFMCFSQFVHFFLLYSLCFYRCFDPWFG